jgi:hypothetical protein
MERFRQAFSEASLDEIKRDFGGALQSADAREFPLSDLQTVVRYSAKLLERPPASVPGEELWTIMPRSLAEVANGWATANSPGASCPRVTSASDRCCR